PQELPVADRHYALTWLLAMVPAEKPPLELPRVVRRLPVPKLHSSEVPKLLLPKVADHEVPEVRPTPPLAAVHVPDPPMPVAPLAQPGPPPKEVVVYTGLLGGGAGPGTNKR